MIKVIQGFSLVISTTIYPMIIFVMSTGNISINKSLFFLLTAIVIFGNSYTLARLAWDKN
jgi:TctA family transporter